MATNEPPKRTPKVLQKCVPLLLRGHREKGTEKRPESLAFKGFPRANPLSPPLPADPFSKRVVQGKCPFHFVLLNGAVCSNILFSNTSALTSSLLFWGNSTCRILEHLVCSNTSGFQFWGPLARTNFLSALCGLPKNARRTNGSIFMRPPVPLRGPKLRGAARCIMSRSCS